MSRFTSILVAAALLVPSTALATRGNNGKYFNTDVLNGKYFNGKYFNGKYFNTAALDGSTGGSPTKPGATLWDVRVEGNGLAGWAADYTSNGQWVFRTGTWFIGTELNGQARNADGTLEPVKLRIDSIAAELYSDVLYHYVTVRGTDGTSYPLCGDGSPAVVLRGEWSHDEGVWYGGDKISDSPYKATFACTNAALGKCATTLRYRPWTPATWVWVTDARGARWEYRDQVMNHQACTRMIRADYCGDGRSWTANGTEIDIYDRFGLHAKSVDPATIEWEYEATWNEHGAVRISCDRLSASPVTCGVNQSFACYLDDGLGDPAARMGNLHRQGNALPPIQPRW